MTETLCTQSVGSSTPTHGAFCPVPADELGFALSVFVAAASGTLTASRTDTSELPERQTTTCEQLFADLLALGPVMVPSRLLAYQTSLHTAFAALWKEYGSHELRDAICARVLCFHFLMEETEGRVVEPWTTACPERPEQVLLSPAVVEGLARVPLDLRAGLVEDEFLAAIGTSQRA